MIKWFLGLNLHLRIAIILAPILGIFGYGLADTWMQPSATEKVEQPVMFREMELASPCILDANECQLTRDEMEVQVRPTQAANFDLVRLDITANQHIRGLQISVVQGEKEDQLVAQTTKVTDHWYVEFPRSLIADSSFTLRLALAQTKKVYLAEFPARF